MADFIHLNKFSLAIQAELQAENYYEALHALAALPDSGFQQETLGDVFSEIDLFGLARNQWRKSGTESATLKANTNPRGRTWIFTGPGLKSENVLPLSGSYSLFSLMPGAQGKKRGLRMSRLHFYPGKEFRFDPSPRISLEFFLKEENSLLNYSAQDLKEGNKAAIKETKWLKVVKEKIVKQMPELAYCILPEKMEFRLKWNEKPFSQRDDQYLKNTLEMLSGEWYNGFDCPWKLKFEPLKWRKEKAEGNRVLRAELLRPVPWKVMDEHLYRTYGVEEFTEGIWESGLWVEVRSRADGPASIKLLMKRALNEKNEPVYRSLYELELEVVEEKWLVFRVPTGKKLRAINLLRDYFQQHE